MEAWVVGWSQLRIWKRKNGRIKGNWGAYRYPALAPGLTDFVDEVLSLTVNIGGNGELKDSN